MVIILEELSNLLSRVQNPDFAPQTEAWGLPKHQPLGSAPCPFGGLEIAGVLESFDPRIGFSALAPLTSGNQIILCGGLLCVM